MFTNLLIALVIGLLAGAHIATWGMYKDAIHEGFAHWKYMRSIMLSGLIAMILAFITDLDMTQASGILILYGLTYATERTVFELYKVFLRQEDQSKYFIPMQFHVGGKVVESRLARYLVGVACIVGILLVLVSLSFLQRLELKIPGLILVLLIGGVGGWLSAFGGAWKDAPVEGFDLLKFFRSPVIALLYAMLISCFTSNYIFIVWGGIGYTIGTIETYKKFFFPKKSPGKFAGKPIHYPEMFVRRQRFVPLYAAIWLTVITTCVIAFTQPHEGLINGF